VCYHILMVIKYKLPRNWMIYDKASIVDQLVNAKAALIALKTIPYQKSWARELQIVQLKREIAGTSRIEGADFTDRELDDALKENIEQLYTRSQRQVASTVKAYRWIAELEDDRPVNGELICNIHKIIITDADDDHCPPGVLRVQDENVTFGTPKHRGCEGGEQCYNAFRLLCQAINQDFRGHDQLIQSLAIHYHFAAMHPFLDGNGRTARALEALMLQKIGLKDSLFIAMSNYYYEEKNEYLKTLANVRASDHNLTAFILFGLKGIEKQCKRLSDEIKKNISKVLFRNMMFNLFTRLQTKKTRIIAERQIEILKILLDESYELHKLYTKVGLIYKNLRNPWKAYIRDLIHLIDLNTIKAIEDGDTFNLIIKLEWATEITESEFYEKIKKLPKSKTHSLLT